MSKSNTWETGLLDLIFKNSDFTTVGDAGGLRGSATAGSIYISLHTADPGETGDQSTNEVAYTNYARVAVARTTACWATSTSTAFNIAAIAFPACGATSAAAVYFGVGASTAGAGKLLYSGSLSASLAVTNGVTPQFSASALTVTED